MRTKSEYKFTMFDLRKDVLATVADRARENDLATAKIEGKRLILNRAKGDSLKAAKAFETSFEKAVDMVSNSDDYELYHHEMPPILANHDAEIDPTTEIEGNVVEVVKSYDNTSFPPKESIYPIISHPSGFQVCTCGAQKYYITCPHTLARTLQMNWADAVMR